jgi:aarF domain-containing kinase
MSLLVAVGQPFSLCPCGSIQKKPCRGVVRLFPIRAALVEAKPRTVPALRDDGPGSGLVLRGDRTDDLQAEARAMARAANASVYSPELLAVKYGSRPIKVFTSLFLFSMSDRLIRYKRKLI